MSAQHMPSPAMPGDMRAVTRKEFYAMLADDPRDIIQVFATDHCVWQTRLSDVWGWSAPGRKNQGDPEAYAVKCAAIAKATGGAS